MTAWEQLRETMGAERCKCCGMTHHGHVTTGIGDAHQKVGGWDWFFVLGSARFDGTPEELLEQLRRELRDGIS